MGVVVKKNKFMLGAVLTVTFFILLYVMHSAAIVSIKGKSLVRYTDNLFASISKSSIYFIPDLLKTSEKYMGIPLDVTIKADQKTALLFERASAQVELKNGELKIKGDLGKILAEALNDADSVFKGIKNSVFTQYGYTEKEVVQYWWTAFKAIEGAYKKAGKTDEIKLFETVRVKALEPAFNFYGVEAASASQRISGIGGIILFYVVYTVWWGFAIYFLCEGVGLLMVKSKEKKEA